MPTRAALIPAATGNRPSPSGGNKQVAVEANANALAACVEGNEEDAGRAKEPRETKDFRRDGRSRLTIV